jgi:hypothetical protein
MPDGGPPIRAAAELDLEQALARMFDPALPDLDRLVLRSTGRGLYEAYTNRMMPTEVQVKELLTGLSSRNENVAFFKAVLLARPDAKGLRELIRAACPESLDGLPEAAAQVELVVRGIDAARAALTDDAIAAPVRAARDDLERLARGLRWLAAYKLLHDGFQKLQLQLPQLLRAAARLTVELEAWVQIEASRAAVEAMRGDAERFTALFIVLPPDTPPNTPGDRAAESRLVARIAGVAGTFKAAIDTEDAEAAQGAAKAMARLIRIEPKRLEMLMSRTAVTLPFAQLVAALEAVLRELERRAAAVTALSAAVDQLHVLRSGLDWQVEIHHLWQDAENDLWAAEDVLSNEAAAALDEACDDFATHWSVARDRHQVIYQRDPGAPWIVSLEKLAGTIEKHFSPWVPEQMRSDFSRYRLRGLSRFFEVDRTLRTHCDAIVALERPLHSMLADLDQ